MTAQAGGASPFSPLPWAGARETRRRLRDLRKGLPDSERLAAHASIRRELHRLRLWQPGRHVAAFLGTTEEVDLRPCFADAWSRGVRLYVPRIVHLRSGQMAFLPLEPGAPLRRNRYGIDEPVAPVSRRIATLSLDAVLVPLLGFDARGHRLGMGAGFYDRALARRLDRAQGFRRPLLIGVAYAIQQVDGLEPAPWDVALDAVVTERGTLRFPPPPRTSNMP